MKFLRFMIKNLLRNRTRTLLTVAGTAAAMFIWVFVEVMQRGIDRAARHTAGETKLVVYYRNRFCPFTSRLPEHYAATIRNSVPGVADVLPVRIFVNNCRASLDVITYHGVPAEEFDRMRSVKVIDGDLEAFRRRQNAALIGRKLAYRRGVKVGDEFRAGILPPVTVAGIFASDSPEEESVAYVHLRFLQQTPNRPLEGWVTQFEVKVRDPALLEPAAQMIDEEFSGAQAPTTTRPARAHTAQAAGDLIQLIGFTRWLGYVCVLVILVLNANTVIMAVQDRVKENAVLQTLGFTPGRVFRMILGESVLVGLIGGVVGTGLALAALAWLQLGVGSEGVRIEFLPEPGPALIGLATALAVSAAAGVVPAFQAARTEIVAALRRV
jgi:putative ABC transport system permease protein